jgi:hypothetical protein
MAKARKDPKEKIKSGRPPIIWDAKDIRTFQECCRIQCTEIEVEAIMGVDDETLVTLINAHLYEDIRGAAYKEGDKPITFSEALKKYGAQGKASLRRKAYAKAMAGSTPELIFLCKNQLGMSDNPNGASDLPPAVVINDYRAR